MIDHRPIAHLLPESGWTNDPIGPVFWRGRTHLFSQVNPEGPYWDRPHWGHMTTDDLVHWERRPIALSPDPDGPDTDGCYSGCIVVIDDVATMFYTGAHGPLEDQVQSTCIARSRDDHLDEWVKDPANPVTTAPDGVPSHSFRDPFVYRDGDRWIQLVGAALPQAGGALLAFTSHDLTTWEPLDPVLTSTELPGDVWTGHMWECPALLRSSSGDAVLVSVHDGAHTPHNTVAILGRLIGQRFEATTVLPFDHGPDLYAPCVYNAPDGRVIVWGWSWEARSVERQHEAGWAGVLTLPREVRVVDGHLRCRPIPEVARLRTAELDPTLTPTEEGWLADRATGSSLDLQLTLAEQASEAQLRVLRSPDLQEFTTIGVDRKAGRVWVDRDRSSTDTHAHDGRYHADVELDPGPVELRVIVDRSIVEVFLAGRVTLTVRVYPTRRDSDGVELVVPPGSEATTELRIWRLGSVWDPPSG